MYVNDIQESSDKLNFFYLVTTRMPYMLTKHTAKTYSFNYLSIPVCSLFNLWFDGLGQAYKSYLKKLLKLQKRALRFIYFSERNQHTIPLFIDAGVLQLKFLYYELLANLMFERRHRDAPGNIQDLFQDISVIHSYNTRSSSSNNIYPQSSRLSIQVNSFSRIGTKIRNECLYL